MTNLESLHELPLNVYHFKRTSTVKCILWNGFGDITDVVFVFLQQWDSVLNGDLSGQPLFFTNVTGSTNYYNFQITKVLFC